MYIVYEIIEVLVKQGVSFYRGCKNIGTHINTTHFMAILYPWTVFFLMAGGGRAS